MSHRVPHMAVGAILFRACNAVGHHLWVRATRTRHLQHRVCTGGRWRDARRGFRARKAVLVWMRRMCSPGGRVGSGREALRCPPHPLRVAPCAITRRRGAPADCRFSTTERLVRSEVRRAPLLRPCPSRRDSTRVCRAVDHDDMRRCGRRFLHRSNYDNVIVCCTM